LTGARAAGSISLPSWAAWTFSAFSRPGGIAAILSTDRRKASASLARIVGSTVLGRSPAVWKKRLAPLKDAVGMPAA
jgi:hypothetical protein